MLISNTWYRRYEPDRRRCQSFRLTTKFLIASQPVAQSYTCLSAGAKTAVFRRWHGRCFVRNEFFEGMIVKRILVGLAAATMACATPAFATEIYTADPGLVGNQADFFGTLGLNFRVNAPIRVDRIGVFDSAGDGLRNDIRVTIFDSNGTALFTPILFAAGTTNASGSAYIFQAIAGLTLNAGIYQLASWGYGGTEPDYNASGPGGAVSFNAIGGRLTALDASYNYTPGGVGNIADIGTTRYGSASLDVSAVPEASTWAMMLLGFGMMGLGLRYRKRKVLVTYA